MLKSSLLAAEYRRYKEHLHHHQRRSPAFSLFVEDWDARCSSSSSTVSSSASASGNSHSDEEPLEKHIRGQKTSDAVHPRVGAEKDKSHAFLKVPTPKVPTRRQQPRRIERSVPSPPRPPLTRTGGNVAKRNAISHTLPVGGIDGCGDIHARVPRDMKVVELGDPCPPDGLLEAGKGGAVRYQSVAVVSELVTVDEDEEAGVEDMPAGCRMVELREPVPLGKLVEREDLNMVGKGKKRNRENGKTVRVGING